MTTEKESKDLKISWFGVDGFLVLLYLVIVGTILYGMYSENDLLLGRIIPYAVMTACTLIFLDYLRSTVTFLRKHHEESGK